MTTYVNYLADLAEFHGNEISKQVGRARTAIKEVSSKADEAYSHLMSAYALNARILTDIKLVKCDIAYFHLMGPYEANLKAIDTISKHVDEVNTAIANAASALARVIDTRNEATVFAKSAHRVANGIQRDEEIIKTIKRIVLIVNRIKAHFNTAVNTAGDAIFFCDRAIEASKNAIDTPLS